MLSLICRKTSFEASQHVGLSVGCLLLAVGVTAVTFEINGYETQVICSQGLSNCSVSDDLPMDPNFEAEEHPLDVQGVQARRPQLCCRNKWKCKLCLAVELQIYVHPQLDMSDEENTEDDHGHKGGGGGRTNGQRASIGVCCTATALPVCKRVWFTLHLDALPLSNTTQLSLVGYPLCVTYGSRAVVSVHASSSATRLLDLSMPSLDQVCSLDLHESIEECDVPTIKTIIDQERSWLELQVGGSSRSQYAVCLQYERNGNCRRINTTTIPLSAVTTCMCLQAWRYAEDHISRRAVSCPFTNHTQALIQRNEWKNLSVSLALVERNKALLLWNLSAPCRVDAQVWPCHRDEAFPHHGCKEITGLRKKLSDSNWRQNNKGHWEIPGAFEDIDLRFPPCVMVKVNRMEYELGPFCIHNVSRWRWTLLIISMVTLFFLAVLILYFQHNKIKRWAKCWHSGKYMQTVRGHVVVLSPPDSGEEGMCELVCGLGSFLREQGLGVSVDQWSHVELCSLGPLPWLYAQLLRLEHRGGGKVVLVLTRGARQEALEWTRLYGWPQQARMEDRGQGPPPTMTASCPYSDVFSASLSCVAGDRQLGRAGERFLLVDFESCPVQLACSDRRLPELLEGLSLFRLPSQNQAMLSELMRGGNSQ